MDSAAFLDALMTLPSIYGAQVSPNGQWVAWTWFRTAPTAEVYAVPTDASSAPIRLTESSENTFLVNWMPDSSAVIVEQDKDGNERAQLFRVNLNVPLTMIPLTEPDPKFFIRGAEVHPNERYLVYGANYDAATDSEIEATWLYRHDLSDGLRLALAKPDKPNWMLPALSADGSHILFHLKEKHPSGQQVHLVDIHGHGLREFYSAGDEHKSYASWLPDSQRILLIAETETHTRIGISTLRNDEIRWLIDDPSRNIEEAYAPDNSDQIVVIEGRDARTHASLLHPTTGEEISVAPLSGNLQPLAPSANGKWVGMYYSSTQPMDIVLFDPSDPRPEGFVSLSRVWERTGITQNDLTAAEDYRWRSEDGVSVQGWLYRAENPRGTVVYVHGGPTAHSQDAINVQIQYFVRQGFNVLDPNYRGSTGFSLAYRELIKQDGWGGREQDDIRAGIEALIMAGIAERGKVGMTGTSYGGYSSWCGITRFPKDILAASAPICGMTDLVVDYETTRPDLRPYSEEMLGGRPDQVPQRYYARSPINFVSNIQGRLLIVQGMQDPNVSPENVRAVTSKLAEHGIEYELLAFEDEGHGIKKMKNQKVLLDRLAKFFGSAFAASS
ncbi:MAG: hypothetical protein OHK0023_13330 [Anaerolineae bacterium]